MNPYPPYEVRTLIDSQVQDLLSGQTGAAIQNVFKMARSGDIPTYTMIHKAILTSGGEMTLEDLERYKAQFNNSLFAAGTNKMLDEEEHDEGNRTKVAAEEAPQPQLPDTRRTDTTGIFTERVESEAEH